MNFAEMAFPDLVLADVTVAPPKRKVLSNQKCAGRDRRHDVSRKLRMRSAEKYNRHGHPEQQKYLPRIFRRRSRKSFHALRPDGAHALNDGGNQHERPGHHRQQKNRQIKPEWLAMMIDILRKACQIMFKNKEAEELRIM